jgi:hypothetical protein
VPKRHSDEEVIVYTISIVFQPSVASILDITQNVLNFYHPYPVKSAEVPHALIHTLSRSKDLFVFWTQNIINI